MGMSVQCLVFSACESGKATSDALNSGLARRLSLRGLPHVVGMRESVLDRAGIQFAMPSVMSWPGGSGWIWPSKQHGGPLPGPWKGTSGAATLKTRAWPASG